MSEVEASVFDRYRVPLYKEAGFKPYIIAAMMLTSKFADPAGSLSDLLSASTKSLKGIADSGWSALTKSVIISLPVVTTDWDLPVYVVLIRSVDMITSGRSHARGFYLCPS